MPQTSAGILLYRRTAGGPEVFLVHPGGPFWARNDDGTWSIPKGLYTAGEEPAAAAWREFEEEAGPLPAGPLHDLGSFRQPGGKMVRVFVLEGDFDLAAFRSNTFALEWPPRSGRMQDFPEADRAGWFGLAEAERKLTRGQQQVLAAFRGYPGIA